MGTIQTGFQDFSEPGHCFAVQLADPKTVQKIIKTETRTDDGRSPWVWIRFPNGDLAMATFPQGDTYFEHEAEYP